MEIVIFLLWFCLIWIIPISFLFTAYIAYLNGRKMLHILVLLAFAMTVFVFISLYSIGPMFEGFFTGGDPELSGSSAGQWKYAAIVAGYAAFGWVTCSVLLGRPIIPGRRLVDPRKDLP